MTEPPTPDRFGDSSYVLQDSLPPSLASSAYGRILEETAWRKMYSFGSEVPRLLSIQHVANEHGDVPVYRHPSDHFLESTAVGATVGAVLEHVNATLGTRLNHALVQYYRTGRDSISEHSDKTLDVAPGSVIVNASFGATRKMTLRFKANKLVPDDCPDGRRRRPNESVPLPDGSLFVMTLDTNADWTHGIRPCAPLAGDVDEGRVSLTFREISTFLLYPPGRAREAGTAADAPASMAGTQIYGSGARAKSRSEARPVRVDDVAAWSAVLAGFRQENRHHTPTTLGRATAADERRERWREWYGDGSDALPCVVPRATGLA